MNAKHFTPIQLLRSALEANVAETRIKIEDIRKDLAASAFHGSINELNALVAEFAEASGAFWAYSHSIGAIKILKEDVEDAEVALILLDVLEKQVIGNNKLDSYYKASYMNTIGDVKQWALAAF